MALGSPLGSPWACLWDRLWDRCWIAVGIVVGIAFGIALESPVGSPLGSPGLAFGISSTRIYYQFVHPPFVWPRSNGRRYLLHPVAWDDLCSVPFPGLDRLLVDYAERVPESGEAEIERLISSYPSQRMMALRAKVRLLARQAGKTANLAILDEILASLPEGKGVPGRDWRVARGCERHFGSPKPTRYDRPTGLPRDRSRNCFARRSRISSTGLAALTSCWERSLVGLPISG